MNILLTGFMGAGKTTVGRKLAKRLGYQFIDTDMEIEDEQSCSVEEIFKYGGEACFRDMETRLLKKLNEQTHDAIIATGGGMIIREENRQLMNSLGKRVYLRVPKEELYQRLNRDQTRPLLKNKEPEQLVTEMLEERGPLYEEADFTIETGKRSPQQIATEIIRNFYDE